MTRGFVSKRQRRLFTLIEMLVAIGLSIMLLTSLLGIYQLLEYQAIRQRKIRESLFSERFLQYRFANGFARTEGSVSDKKNEDEVVFYTSEGTSSVALGKSLVFITDRGPDHYAEFSNKVLTRLYRDAEKNLCFAYWPIPSRWDSDDPPPMHKEVLFEGVTELDFEFYSPPDPEGKVVGGDDPVKAGRDQVTPPFDQWLADWDIRYKQLPVMIRVYITRDSYGGGSAREVYGYVIPASKSHIIYGS
ncbi:Uncharacterized protein SCG7086_BW_00070 [Chlamydiales bacterium SCGC AG-110-P3]|nr:Uncharacterized protein SCG7086_BW_00070 [Chlamydiales bacterium SCGC AG-110-P3]